MSAFMATTSLEKAVVNFSWKLAAGTIPKGTESLGPLVTPTFAGGEPIGIPCHFSLETEVVDRKVNFKVNVDGIRKNPAEAELEMKIDCLDAMDRCLCSLYVPRSHFKAGTTCQWDNAFSVARVWKSASSANPAHIVKFQASISILGGLKSTLDTGIGPTAPKRARHEPETINFTDEPGQVDLILEAEGVHFGVQRSIIIAQSPEIRRLIQQSPTGIQVTTLNLNTDEDTAVHALSFIHAGALLPETTLDNMARLLELAETFEIPTLSEACYDRLVDLADPDNRENMELIQGLSFRYGSNEPLSELLNVYANGVPSLEDLLEENEDEPEEEEDEEVEEEDDEAEQEDDEEAESYEY